MICTQAGEPLRYPVFDLFGGQDWRVDYYRDLYREMLSQNRDKGNTPIHNFRLCTLKRRLRPTGGVCNNI